VVDNEVNAAGLPINSEHELGNGVEVVTSVAKSIRVPEVLIHELIRGWSQLGAKGVDVGRAELE
jgi:hypothetical protein